VAAAGLFLLAFVAQAVIWRRRRPRAQYAGLVGLYLGAFALATAGLLALTAVGALGVGGDPSPGPSPKRGGEEGSSPPPRFGEGAGGRGFQTASEPQTSPGRGVFESLKESDP